MSTDYLVKIKNVPIECLVCEKLGSCSEHENKTIYHQQSEIIRVASSIFIKFGRSNEVVLLAQTQSGKSDVIKRILEIWKGNMELIKRDFGIYNIFIIICASDNDLRKQHQDKFCDYLTKDHIFHLGDIVKITKALESIDKIKDKTQLNLLNNMYHNSLIIFDESHCDLGEQDYIDRYRKALGITFKKKTNNKIKVLNVSATPYDHMRAEIDHVILYPRKNYYGIINMFDNDRVHQSYDLTNSDNVKELFEHILKNYKIKKISSLPTGYYIIRVNNDKEEKSINCNIKNYFKSKTKYNTMTYYMDEKIDINEYLKECPKLPTFIFVKDKMRKGKTIIKKNIICVHDSPNNTYTHTTYQGFIGRMTGFDANKSALIYCDIEKAKEHLEWIKDDYDINNIPLHGQWSDKKGNIKKSCLLSVS